MSASCASDPMVEVAGIKIQASARPLPAGRL